MRANAEAEDWDRIRPATHRSDLLTYGNVNPDRAFTAELPDELNANLPAIIMRNMRKMPRDLAATRPP